MLLKLTFWQYPIIECIFSIFKNFDRVVWESAKRSNATIWHEVIYGSSLLLWSFSVRSFLTFSNNFVKIFCTKTGQDFCNTLYEWMVRGCVHSPPPPPRPRARRSIEGRGRWKDLLSCSGWPPGKVFLIISWLRKKKIEIHVKKGGCAGVSFIYIILWRKI